jgi:hypothetical protein
MAAFDLSGRQKPTENVGVYGITLPRAPGESLPCARKHSDHYPPPLIDVLFAESKKPAPDLETIAA